MARAGNGTARYVQPGQDMTATVLGQLKQALLPSLTDVSISWALGGSPLEVGRRVATAPARVPPVFHLDRFLCFARFPPGATVEGATIRARSPSGPLEVAVAGGEGATAAAGRVLWRLAAREAIAEFEAAVADGSRWTDPGRLASGGWCWSEEEAVRLAVAEGLVTKRTALVAVEAGSGRVRGGAELEDSEQVGALARLRRPRADCYVRGSSVAVLRRSPRATVLTP
mmetsp:Transcript_74725/g.200193  ORF Transcript_74725/g.200193 Transcript_74725/m.200193 type:complete len:227 (+) Transcript_74725:1331-2011(+)